jgi:ketosteroid isomerase-like protein
MVAMDDDLDSLRHVNERFYKALEELDLATMDRLWLHEGWVRCVHPGWDAVVGWEAVRQSWARIFANTSWMRVTATDVELVRFGDIGLVACAENITTQAEEAVGVAVALATNLYRRTANGWRLIHHHASPAPVHVTQPFSGSVQ